MKLAITHFGGTAPIRDPEALPDHMAQVARDCRLDSGKLVPLRQNRSVAVPANAGDKGLYLWTYTQHKLVCGAAGSTTPAAWEALADGAFTITIDGTEFEPTPDFDGVTDMAGVAAAIQEAIREATAGIERVVWDTDHFVVWTDSTVDALTAPEEEDGVDKTDISAGGWMNGQDGAGTSVDTDTESWLTWPDPVDVVRSSVAGDRFNRIYFTGAGKPKVKGTAAGELREYDLAMPVPEHVPLLEIVPQYNFTKFRYYIEEAGSAPYPSGATELTDFTRDGLVYTFSASVTKTVSRWTEYRVIVEGYCDNCDTPGWYVCKTAQSLAMNGGLNVWWITYWDEDTNNGAHAADAFDMAVEAAESEATMGLSVGMNQTKMSLNYSLVETSEVVSADMSWRITFKVTPEGTFPNTDTAWPRYVYAYVSEWGEEGPASEPSAEIRRENGENVRVWTPTTVPDDLDRGIIKKRIYQTDGNGDWAFLMDVPLDEPDTTDTANADVPGSSDVDDGELVWEAGVAQKSFARLGEILTDGMVVPDDELQGLVQMPAGYYAAFKDREVWFSLPHRPEAWGNQLSLHDPVVVLMPTGNELFALTTGTHAILSGSDPAYLQVSRIQHDDIPVSKEGTTQVRNLVLAPGPDGLSAFVGGQADIYTKAFHNARTWAAVGPETLVAAGHDGAYVGFNANGGILLDTRAEEGALTALGETTITALHRVAETDALYAIDGNEIVQLDDPAADCRTLTWRSKDFVLPVPRRWVAAKVRAAGYDGTLQLRLYGDGALVHVFAPADDRAGKIPIHERCSRWSLEVVADVPVYEIAVASSIGGGADMSQGKNLRSALKSVPTNDLRDPETRRSVRAIVDLLQQWADELAGKADAGTVRATPWQGESVGGGAVILSGKKGSTWLFRTLAVGSGLRLDNSGDTIRLTADREQLQDVDDHKVAADSADKSPDYLGEKIANLGGSAFSQDLVAAVADGKVPVRVVEGDGAFIRIVLSGGDALVPMWTCEEHYDYDDGKRQVAGHGMAVPALFEIVAAIGETGSEDKLASEKAVRDLFADVLGNDLPEEDVTTRSLVTDIQFSGGKIQVKTTPLTAPNAWWGTETGWTDKITAEALVCPS